MILRPGKNYWMSITEIGGAKVQICDPQPRGTRSKGLVFVTILQGELCEVRDGLPNWIGPGSVRAFEEKKCHFVELSKAMGGTK